MKPIIRVENLSKQYRISTHQPSYGTLRDSLTTAIAAPFQKIRNLTSFTNHRSPATNHRQDTIWALKGIDFEVMPGEVVGIIGRNGAGKSTLLKILSRITAPTTGCVDLYGRVGSLLEVGTGFHPELTGRENLYLNGVILGMKRYEIDKRFDEIISFAEMEKFVDTPVKRYSSGMYLRLAFAVAAHLEPEILLVDEVLAVGDASFQRRCLDKMQDVSRQGRTVLFVSHNMSSITRLCERTILLDQGKILQDGPSYKVISAYLNSGLGTTAKREWTSRQTAPGNECVRLRSIRVHNEEGETTDAVDIRRSIGIEMEFDVLKSGYVLTPNYHFYNEEGVCAFIISDQDPAWKRYTRPEGRYTSTAWIPGNFLAEGTMIVGAAISTMDPVRIHFHERDVVAFQVVDSLDGNSARGDYAGPMPGVVRPLLHWTTQYERRRPEDGAMRLEVRDL